MPEDVKIEYVPGSDAGKLDIAEVAKFQQWLHDSGQPHIVFDSQYVNHLLYFHGGVPVNRFFLTQNGTRHVVERFLNFAPRSVYPELQIYNIEVVWSALCDRLGVILMPFAELAFGDELCFDYSTSVRPSIVVWYHELSHENRPHIEIVCENFDSFLQLLRDAN